MLPLHWAREGSVHCMHVPVSALAYLPRLLYLPSAVMIPSPHRWFPATSLLAPPARHQGS